MSPWRVFIVSLFPGGLWSCNSPEFIFHVEQHVFSLLLTSDCATRMRSSEGKAVSRGNQWSSRRLLSLGIQDNNSGKRQPDLFLDVQTLLRTIPTAALAVCPCIHAQDSALHEGARAAFLIQHWAVCLQPWVSEGPKACSFLFLWTVLFQEGPVALCASHCSASDCYNNKK